MRRKIRYKNCLYLLECIESDRSKTLEKILINNKLNDIYTKLSNGKPILSNSNKGISISHSELLYSVFISEFKQVGVDIELLVEKDFDSISNLITKQEIKFLSIFEGRDFLINFYKLWTIKESLYKIGKLESMALEVITNRSKKFTFKSYLLKGHIISVVYPLTDDNNYIKVYF